MCYTYSVVKDRGKRAMETIIIKNVVKVVKGVYNKVNEKYEQLCKKINSFFEGVAVILVVIAVIGIAAFLLSSPLGIAILILILACGGSY